MPLEFTNNWFEATAKSYWEQLIPKLNSRRILEIGSFEGASTCYLIDKLASADAPLEIHCVDNSQKSLLQSPFYIDPAGKVRLFRLHLRGRITPGPICSQ